MRGVDPEIRGVACQFLVLTVAPGDGAGCDAGAAAGFHVGGGVSDEETVCGADSESFQGAEQDVGLWLRGKAVGSLDVIEVVDQGELFED